MVFFALMIKPVLGASLEITAPPLISLPTLVFIETENAASNIAKQGAPEQAQIISYMSTFKPAIQVVSTGTEMVVINADSILHNTHVFDHNRTLFNVATPTTEISVQRKLFRPGLFNVRCDLHPSMNAWIAVVSNPYYAVIEKAGVFSIDNIKPGHYKLHIQQSGRQEQILSVELISKEQKKIQLPLR